MNVLDLMEGTAVMGLLCLTCPPIRFLLPIFVLALPFDVFKVVLISTEASDALVPLGLVPDIGLSTFISLSDGNVNNKSF